MNFLSLRNVILVLLVAIFIWSSSLHTCNARRGTHWRQNRVPSASLSKKTKNHNHHHNGGNGSKKKPPSSAPSKKPSEPKVVPFPPPPSPPPPSKKPTEPKFTPSPPPPSSAPPSKEPNEPKDVPLPPPPPSSPPSRKPNKPKDVPLPPPPPSSPPSRKPNDPIDAPSTPLLPPSKGNDSGNSTMLNVLDFGAKGDGNTEDTKAFQAAWAAACKVEASTMLVPSEFIFLVGPISFSGPNCEADIVFQLDGTIIAPTNAQAWGSGLLQWLEFSKLRGITIKGKGLIDGRGSVWWQSSPLDDPTDDEPQLIIPTADNNAEKKLNTSIGSELVKMPIIKPTALRFYGSSNVIVTGITIQNSPLCHLKFDNCISVQVFNISVSSPGDSPNTDGIHLQNSQDVLIHSANLSCGDDCVSIQTGCSNVYIHSVYCGPGHGISIGSLGKDSSKACVSNITVRDIMMNNTKNGVRIKTWQGGLGSVQNVLFSNIQVSEVEVPIIIDQYYCDKRTCTNQTSAVALSGITYEKIRGTYTYKPVHLACSDSLPCVGVILNNIALKPLQERNHLFDPFCWAAFGELSTPTIPPIDCLKKGKPTSSRIQSASDTC